MLLAKQCRVDKAGWEQLQRAGKSGTPPRAVGSIPKPLWLGKLWLPHSGVQAQSCLLLTVAQEAPGTHPEMVPWSLSMC